MIPLEFQKFQITELQLTSQLNKQRSCTVIIKAYGKSLRPNLGNQLLAQRSKYQLNLPLQRINVARMVNIKLGFME